MKFNMTPIIDIVFLLIIFLVVVCGQIDAENFEVSVPDKCRFAQPQADKSMGLITITVVKDIEKKQIIFAVGAEKTNDSLSEDITAWLVKNINRQLKNSPAGIKTICLRIDRDISYFYAQKALAAAAQSTAEKIQLATLKENATSNPQF